MIRVNIHVTETWIEFSSTGHATEAENKDFEKICASASIIDSILAEIWLHTDLMYAASQIKTDKANARFCVEIRRADTCDDFAWNLVTAAAVNAWTGYSILAEEYPECVTVRVVDEREETDG